MKMPGGDRGRLVEVQGYYLTRVGWWRYRATFLTGVGWWRYRARKVHTRLPGKGNLTPMAHGWSTKIISMTERIRTSRLSFKKSLSTGGGRGRVAAAGEGPVRHGRS